MIKLNQCKKINWEGLLIKIIRRLNLNSNKFNHLQTLSFKISNKLGNKNYRQHKIADITIKYYEVSQVYFPDK